MVLQNVVVKRCTRVSAVALAAAFIAGIAVSQSPSGASSGAGQKTRPASQPAAASRPVGTAARFSPLFRFCPSEFESLMLVDFEAMADGKDVSRLLGSFKALAGQARAAKPARMLMAGRRVSSRGVSVGSGESFTVVECASDGPDLDSQGSSEGKYTRHEILGVPCFEMSPLESGESKEGPAETWVAVVEKRFVLTVTRRATLEAALARRGPTIAAAVEHLGFKVDDVDWRGSLTIIRRYDADSRRDGYAPLNKDPGNAPPTTRGLDLKGILFRYDDRQRTFRVTAQTSDAQASLRYFRELCGDPRALGTNAPMPTTDPRASRVDIKAQTAGAVDLEGSFSAQGGSAEIAILTLYGYNTFI